MIGAGTIQLTGLGMSSVLADIIGGDYFLAVGKGITQAGAQPLVGDNSELSTASGQTAFLLPVTQQIAEAVFVVNPSATTALIYAPLATHALNGSTTVPLSVPQNKAAIIWQYKPKFWVSLLSNF
jgi:hypothetical protein